MLTPGIPTPKGSRRPRLEKTLDWRKKRPRIRKELSKARQRTSYGGSDWQAFKKTIFIRDGNRCAWCSQSDCRPLTVHHVRQRVGMGGRKKVSVNYPENAITLGPLCHSDADDRRISEDQLEARLSERYGYEYAPKEAA